MRFHVDISLSFDPSPELLTLAIDEVVAAALFEEAIAALVTAVEIDTNLVVSERILAEREPTLTAVLVTTISVVCGHATTIVPYGLARQQSADLAGG